MSRGRPPSSSRPSTPAGSTPRALGVLALTTGLLLGGGLALAGPGREAAAPAAAPAPASVSLIAATSSSLGAPTTRTTAPRQPVRTTPPASATPPSTTARTTTGPTSTTAATTPGPSSSSTGPATTSPDDEPAATPGGAAPSDTAPSPARRPVQLDRPMYVDPTSSAAQWVAAHPSDPLAARITRWITSVPSARWFVRDSDAQWTSHYVQQAASAGTVPVLVAYNLPNRDCGSHSFGGAVGLASYLSWMTTFAQGIGSTPTVVLLEPDSLFYVDCLDRTGLQERFDLLQRSIDLLEQYAPGALVYLDGGSPYAPIEQAMADKLAAAGVDRVRGFAVNINNFFDDATNHRYAATVQQHLLTRHGITGTHYFSDSSRNGNGSDGVHWCNPEGRALGVIPAWTTDGGSFDGYVWTKRPGESDGSCGLAPTSHSGDFVPTLADSLLVGAGR